MHGAIAQKCQDQLNQPQVLLTGFRYLYQVATQLSSRGWLDHVSDSILPEKILRYSWESTPGSLE